MLCVCVLLLWCVVVWEGVGGTIELIAYELHPGRKENTNDSVSASPHATHTDKITSVMFLELTVQMC